MPARARRLSITGLKEIKATLATLTSEIDGAELYQIMGDAVRPIQTAAKANIGYLSTTVSMDVNVAAKQPPSRPRKKTVMVVANKKRTMRVWTAARNNTNPASKVGAGGKVAEGLGTMFELGTSRGMKDHHWFKRAADSKKSEVGQNLKEGLSGLIERVIARRQIPSAT